MIVLGVDGMDPVFLEKHWSDLPHLNQLRQSGDFRRLGTTIPPQSPVAWASVTTGMDPGGHGIFDFIHRAPGTPMPVSSMAEAAPASRTLQFGPYMIPLAGGSMRNLRKGTAFWHTLADHAIPSTVIRMPANFPPEQCEAESLAGMGTPDLEGSFGTFTLFTNDPEERREQVAGGRITRIAVKNGSAVLSIRGPENALRKDHAITAADFTVHLDPTESVMRLDVPGKRIILREGEWSDWIRLQFPMLPLVKSAAGIVRVYLQKAHPYVRIYVSPVNIDPENPELPISTPADFSRTLARKLGLYSTQGIAEESAAFRAGIFNRAEYLTQSRKILDDSLRMFRQEMARFQDGLLFYYFSTIDQNSHMLWGRHEDDLLVTYRTVDQAIGEAMKKAGGDTPLLVISDHGFAPFRRAVHLNAWLQKQGFLTLTDASRDGDEELFAHVDWNKTKAYALGLNSIYLNVESKRLVRESIAGKLLEFRDPVSNEKVISKVYFPDTAYKGRNIQSAPDLIVGYKAGYRGSWQTALGAVPRQLIEDNNDAWIGDHCMAADEVPGVLLSNRKIRAQSPQLYDIPATILKEFQISLTEGMIGSTVF